MRMRKLEERRVVMIRIVGKKPWMLKEACPRFWIELFCCFTEA